MQNVQNDQQRYSVRGRRLSWSREAKENMTEKGLDIKCLVGGFCGDKVVWVFEFVKPVVNMSGKEEAVTINFLGVLGVQGL